MGHTGEVDKDADWYAEAAVAFLRGAAAAGPVEGARPLTQVRPLLALPFVGTGAGGFAAHKGRAMQALVDHIGKLLRDEVDADVVLVLRNDEAFAAAQHARSRTPHDPWSDLPAAAVRVAVELADRARDARLVLFFGAGASVGAGLPSWSGLLAELAEVAGVPAAEREPLRALSSLDAAAILERRLAARATTLGRAVARIMRRDRGSLVHQLLASLPVDEAATTNYDSLFEQAWAGAGKEHVVLPSDAAQTADRWLLKLHGTVERPERIVLSRADYLRFESSDQALAGVVQAMLLTRHMLFVGYSLSDDNFHRLVHQVRAAVAGLPGHREPFGTVLVPSQSALVEELWSGSMRFVSTGALDGSGPRRLAILLDRINADAASPAGHLLDNTYREMLSEDERALRDTLLRVNSAAKAAGVSPSIRRVVERTLRVFGTSSEAAPPTVDAQVEAVVLAARAFGPPDGWPTPDGYGSLALCVLDAIWSIGVRYAGVTNVVARYRELVAARGGDADTHGPAELLAVATHYESFAALAAALGNRQRTSTRSGILKAEAVTLGCQVLADLEIWDTTTLLELDDFGLSTLRKRFIAVPGQGSGLSFDYLLMLAGRPGVKGDRMVRRFVGRALGVDRDVRADEASALVTAAAAVLDVDAHRLDFVIWGAMSDGRAAPDGGDEWTC